MVKLKLAGTVIKFDMPDIYIGPYMPLFACGNGEKEDVTINFALGQIPPVDMENSTGFMVHKVFRVNGSNCYMLSMNDYVTHFIYNNEYTEFTFNVNEKLFKNAYDLDNPNNINGVGSILRRMCIMITAARGGICLHASTIKYGNDAISFSASSGVGKTTQTNLWMETFPGVEVINGDNGYLFEENGLVYFHSVPWCGTSNQCMNVKAPVKAVVFLEQANHNYIHKLDTPEAFMRLSARCFMPVWEKNLMVKAIDTSERIINMVNCYLLRCLPDTDAVLTAKSGIYGLK